MNASIAPNEIEFTASDLTRLEECSEASVDTLDLQDEPLHRLIAHIPTTEQWLIEAMTWLVDTLQFETIATLMQNQEESS